MGRVLEMKNSGKSSPEIARLLFKESKLKVTPEAITYRIKKAHERDGDLYPHHSPGRPHSLDDRALGTSWAILPMIPSSLSLLPLPTTIPREWILARTLEDHELYPFIAAQKPFLKP